MRLLLDTSVLLAACGSERGASREIFRRGASCRWHLLTTPYVIEEVLVNLPDLSATATAEWARLRRDLAVADAVLTLDRPAAFGPAKDRPILFGALA
jgi:predicted nucleic acid-binding protein